jgi:hypothetical protein
MEKDFVFEKPLEEYARLEHVRFMLNQMRFLIKDHCNIENNYQFIESFEKTGDQKIFEPLYLMNSVAISTPIYSQLKDMREIILKEILSNSNHTSKGYIMLLWKNIMTNISENISGELIPRKAQKMVLTLCGIVPMLVDAIDSYLIELNEQEL